MRFLQQNRALQWGLAALLTGGLLYIYLPTMAWLGQQWVHPGSPVGMARDWSHGPIVVLIVALVLWRRRREVFSGGPRTLWGAPLVLSGFGLYLAGDSLNAPYLSAYALIPLVAGLVWLFMGAKTGYRLLAPLMLLLLAVPFPAAEWGIVGLLQWIVATGSSLLVGLLGTPVERSFDVLSIGRYLTMGPYVYWVEPLYSRFNVIMALLALVLPVLYLKRAAAKTIVAALVWVPALGLAAKILLVGIALAITPHVGMDTALVLYHQWLGVPFFVATLASALLIIIIDLPEKTAGRGMRVLAGA